LTALPDQAQVPTLGERAWEIPQQSRHDRDDLGLTLQTGFVTKALVGLFGADRFRLAVSAGGSTFFDGLSIDNATGIVDQPRLPRLKAYPNYDNHVGVGASTKIGLNNADCNDQGAFDAGTNLVTASMDGTYLIGATLLYKVNSSTSARMRGRLVLNGTSETEGPTARSAAVTSPSPPRSGSRQWSRSPLAISWNSKGISARRTGISRPITHPSGAARSAEQREDWPMTPPRSEQGCVPMPDAGFEGEPASWKPSSGRFRW